MFTNNKNKDGRWVTRVPLNCQNFEGQSFKKHVYPVRVITIIFGELCKKKVLSFFLFLTQFPTKIHKMFVIKHHTPDVNSLWMSIWRLQMTFFEKKQGLINRQNMFVSFFINWKNNRTSLREWHFQIINYHALDRIPTCSLD